MPIERNLAASGGRSSNPREREPTNQYQGPSSGIAVVKTAVMVGHSLHFVFPIPFKNIQLGHSGSHRHCLWHGGAFAEGLPREAEKRLLQKTILAAS